MFAHPFIRKIYESEADTHRAKANAKSTKPRGTRSLDLSPSLASSTVLKCSICLDVFTNPITTPCGHNFCKTCLEKCWNNRQVYDCPICKKHSSKNLSSRKHLKTVLCDVCTEPKMEALKSCPVCQSSYCETHLERHFRIPGLKQHKLIHPVKNLQDHLCQKHDRPLELFCKSDQTCVCAICIVTEHNAHNNVSVEEESKEKKTQLTKRRMDMQQMIKDRIKKTEEIQHSIKLRKKNTEKEEADCVELFTDLIRSIESCQSELLEVMEEKQKAAEKQAEEFIKELEKEIIELKRRDIEMEQLSRTEDHLHLLQIYPSLCSPLATKSWTGISINTCVSVETLRTALAQLQETVDRKLNQTVMKRIQQYAVDVTLNPCTANAELILSEDGKQVQHRPMKHDYSLNNKRFDIYAIVLGKEAFASGRFYFEVQVKGRTQWNVGVARESISRKRELHLCPENGIWTLWQCNENMYKACDSPPVSLSLNELRKVGVFVDYEEGMVSFYDVESRSHIYSFTGQSFTEKLYPCLSPCSYDKSKYSEPLIISPVSYNG